MYSGNSTVVNFLMRFPVLIPIAAIIGIVPIVLPEPTAPPVQPPLVVQVPPAPKTVPPAPKPLQPVEALCPPQADLTKAKLKKLKPQELKALKAKGCIKG